MNQNADAKLIVELRQKIKQMQADMSERMRNFLVHKGMSNIPLSPVKYTKLHAEVQTEMDWAMQTPNDLYSSSHSFGVAESPNNNQGHSIQMKEEEQVSRKLKMSKYSQEKPFQDHTASKTRICDVLSKLIEEKKQMETEKYESQTVAESTRQDEKLNKDHKEFREVVKLRKEIKKLKTSLQFQKKVCEQTQAGLMVSEEENYQFRLRIQQLQKQIQSGCVLHQKQKIECTVNNIGSNQLQRQIRSRDDLILQLEQELTHERQMKEQYLDSCLSAKISIDNLNGQLESLEAEIQYLRNTAQNGHKYSGTSSYRMQSQLGLMTKEDNIVDEPFLQALKELAFSISNCIPITDDYEAQANLFMPQNQGQILEALKRVEDYCKNIEKWQRIQQQSMQSQKKIFLKFIETIALKISAQIKLDIIKQLQNQQKLKIYQRIFTPDRQRSEADWLSSPLKKDKDMSVSSI